jgi:PAS domain S-box-containing protein
MITAPYLDRFGFALAGCGAGLVLARLINSPIGHVAAIAAVIAALGLVMAAVALLADRKRAKRVSGKAEQALRIIESMPALAWFADVEGKFLYTSRSPRVFTGLPKEDLAATKDDEFGFRNVVHPDDLDRLLQTWRHSLRTGHDYNCEHRMRRANGGYRWCRSFGLPTRDGDGRIVGWYGTTIDIDELKTAEAALREHERSLQQLIDTVPVLIWRLSPQGNPVYFNKQLVEYIGVPVAQLGSIDAVVEAIIHPDDAIAVRNAVQRGIETGEPFGLRHRLRRSDGTYRWVDARAEPMCNSDGDIVQWYGVCLDIDAQMHAEDALRRSERKLQQLTDAVPALVWSTEPDGTPTYVSKRFTEATGATLEDITSSDGRPSLSVVHPEDRPEAIAAFKRSCETGAPYLQRYRQVRRGGIYRWTETRAEPLRDDAGNIIQWYGVSVDIHDMMCAQQAMQQSERQLQLLVDTVPTQIWCVTPTGEPSYINKTMMDYIGMKLEDFDAKGGLRSAIGDLVHPDDRDALYGALSHSLRTGETFALRFRNRRADGVYRWQEGRAEPLRNERGEIIQWYGANVDIDDQLATEEALRNSTRQLQQMIDAVPINILSFDPSGKLTSASKRYLEHVGMPPAHVEDFEGLARHLAHPDDLPVMLPRGIDGFATGTPFVNRFRRRDKDGTYPWIEARAQPLRDADGAIVQWYMVSIDIGDEVRAHEALRKRERELSQLVDALPVHIWSWTPAGELAYVNKRSLEDLGLSSATFKDTTTVARELVHPDDAPEVLRTSLSCLRTGDPFMMRYRRRWKDGSYRWMEGRCEPLRDRDGTIMHWYQVSIDIDDQVRTDEALRESERSLRQLVETLPAMIDCAAPNGEPIYRSQQLRGFLGYELDALDGTGKTRLDGTLDAGVHPDDLAGVKERYAHSLATGEPYARRHRLRRFDGEYRWVETRAEAMRNTEGAIVQWNVICLDIDGEVRAQEALLLAQERLARASQAASLAELSASIAHEVNQPLAAVIANSHACQRWLAMEPPNIDRAHRTVERIIRDANAAADVVSRIRALFKQSMDSRIPMALGSLVNEARELMAEVALRRSVRMEFEVEKDLPPVAVDRVQLQQVLINLIRNGMEAMDALANGKVLRLRMRRVAESIQTEISDRGPGFEHPDRLFEPFFTTKEHGMGMGLAICRSIIESHGGKLWAETSEPAGATFIFTLPIEARDAA